MSIQERCWMSLVQLFPLRLPRFFKDFSQTYLNHVPYWSKMPYDGSLEIFGRMWSHGDD